MKKLGAQYMRKAARMDASVKNSLDKIRKSKPTSVTNLDFRSFIKLVFPNYQFYKWNEILIDRLEEVVEGKLNRLIVQVPPRHGKSQLVSRLFPAYYLLKHQNRFVAVTSYGATLAEGFSRAARAFYCDAGGRMDPASSSVKIWQTEQRGGLFASGVGGALTGRGAHLGIVDDPIKDRKEAESQVVRATLKDWYGSTFRTRIEPEDGSIVIVQTRWHEDDLVGQLLETEESVEEENRENWHVLDLPAICEPYDERPELQGDPTIEEDWRKPGEALCPERYPLRALARIRASVGEREWAALYQQSPRPSGGNIIDPDWFEWYDEQPKLISRIVLSVDCTFTAADTSDYVGMTVIGESAGKFYLLDVINERMDIVQTMLRIQAKVKQWGPAAVLVEAAANGHAVMQLLKQKIPNLIGIKPSEGGSKIVRTQAIAPIVEAGSVCLPSRATFIEPFVQQMTMFPSAKHDDMVDAFTQALTWLTRRPAFSYGEMTYGRATGLPSEKPVLQGWH